MTTTIRDLAQWPERVEDVTVDAVLRTIGVEAQRTNLQKWISIERKDEDGKALYRTQVEAFIGLVGFMGCLRALRDTNPDAALQYARLYWEMCDDGGSLGEFLWEWLEAAGVDPALVEQALAVAAVDPVASR